MTVKMRQRVEKLIARAFINSAIAAGYRITVNNDRNANGDNTIEKSNDPRAVLKAMFTSDEDILMLYKVDEEMTVEGWAQFIYGNSGWDVISNYTTNLEPIMVAATKVSDKYSD